MRYAVASVMITAAIYIQSITTCRIQVKMQSKTEEPFQMQIHVPAIQMISDRVTFTKMDEIRTVSVCFQFLTPIY